MSHKTLPIDLDLRNLEWLKAQTQTTDRRSMSEIVNQVIAKARNGGVAEIREVRSAVGQARIFEDDPELAGADAAIRNLFEQSRSRFEAD